MKKFESSKLTDKQVLSYTDWGLRLIQKKSKNKTYQEQREQKILDVVEEWQKIGKRTMLNIVIGKTKKVGLLLELHEIFIINKIGGGTLTQREYEVLGDEIKKVLSIQKIRSGKTILTGFGSPYIWQYEGSGLFIKHFFRLIIFDKNCHLLKVKTIKPGSLHLKI